MNAVGLKKTRGPKLTLNITAQVGGGGLGVAQGEKKKKRGRRNVSIGGQAKPFGGENLGGDKKNPCTTKSAIDQLNTSTALGQGG